MGPELNLDPIRAIEEQVEEHKKAIIELNRARNSLLNVSTLVPPEILGRIFYWIVTLGREHDGQTTPYDFLLVCHYWFEVASRTPDLWIFWGDCLEEWELRHNSLRAARLDLELDGYYGVESQPLNGLLREALQDRAARDTIWRVCLAGGDYGLMNSVISSITTSGEGIQTNGVESFTLRAVHDSESVVELSDFFARYNFPKLQELQLSGRYSISPWDSLASRTTVLTTLDLQMHNYCSTPTTRQLLSVLSSNPNLRTLYLSRGALPRFDGDGSSSQVQLCHLKKLMFSGRFRDAIGLLDRLVPSERMDSIHLNLFDCLAPDLAQALGPYLGNHLRRRGKLQQGPAIGGGCSEKYFALRAGDVKRFNDLDRSEDGVNWFLQVFGAMAEDGGPRGEECEKLFLDSLAHIPHGHIIYYESTCRLLKSANIFAGISNLIELRPGWARLSEWFAEPSQGGPHPYWELPPSLKYLSLRAPILDGGDWSPLTNFLSRRASVGNRLDSLTISGSSHVCSDVVEDIRGMVENFEVLRGPEVEDSTICPRCGCLGEYAGCEAVP